MKNFFLIASSILLFCHCAGAAALFNAAPLLVAGTGPRSVAIADFDGDGRADFAVTNGATVDDDGTCTIFVAKNNGRFEPGFTFDTLGLFPNAIAAADFNRDGEQDLAVLNAAPPSGDSFNGVLIIALGNGDGTFQTPTQYSVGEQTVSLAIGDLNHDGKLDIAVGNYGNNLTGTIDVFLGNGDGTFTTAPDIVFQFLHEITDVAIGDLNGDNNLDLVASDGGIEKSGVEICLGHGDGTFEISREKRFADETGLPFRVALGDFNGDGKLDVATQNEIINADGDLSTVAILLGNGRGGLKDPVSYPVARGWASLMARDLNGDGKLDVAAVSSEGNGLAIFPGNGDGTLQPATNYMTGANSGSLAAGDLNGDGLTDLLVSDYYNAAVNLFYAQADGTFAGAHDFLTGPGPLAVASGDFNNDGKQDVAVANYTNGTVTVYLGDGAGNLSAGVNYSVELGQRGPSCIVSGDLNGDGKIDLAVGGLSIFDNQSSVSILLGQGDGTFLSGNTFPTLKAINAILAGDFNGDGKPDLIAAISAGSRVNTVSFYAGKGDGTFQSPPVNSAAENGPVALGSGDFNRDGKLDLAVVNSDSNSVSVLFGQGDGTFASEVHYDAGKAPASIAVADLNGDGFLDLAVANMGAKTISEFFGSSTGAFQPAVTLNAKGSPTNIIAADFDRDGAVDLATSLSSPPLPPSDMTRVGVAVFLNNGSGNFTTSKLYAAGSPGSLVAGDFKIGSGPDIAVLSGALGATAIGTVTILLNTSP